MSIMAAEETRPLLGQSNLPWNRRLNTSPPVSSGVKTSSDLQGNDSGPSSKRTKSPDNKIRHPWQVRIALAAILLSVVLERLSFYGLSGNLVLFLNKDPYLWESYHAVSSSFLFFGVSYIMSLVGGWISDSLLGRFKVIILAYGIYLCGYIMLPFLAEKPYNQATENKLPLDNMSFPGICDYSSVNRSVDQQFMFDEPCAWLIFITLITIATGSGILKANICPFGADQLVQASQETQSSFYNLFYWCVNIGSCLGLGAITYVEQEYSFQTGFIICFVCLGCSAIVFMAGRCCYISRPPDGSVLTNIFKILRGAWQNKRQQKTQHHYLTTTDDEGKSPTTENRTGKDEGKIPFLDYAKRSHGGIFHDSLVDDVKKLGTILMVFAVLIPYWLVYFQSLHMRLVWDRNLTIHDSSTNSINFYNEDIPSPNITAAWFNLVDAIVVIILLPLFDRVIYPRMARAGYYFTFSKRIVLGMLFAIAAMLAAGTVEHYRLKKYWPKVDNASCESHIIVQEIGDTIYFAADMSAFWLIPQYAFIGISEVFASVASLQFAVTFAPKSMKAIVTGLFYFISGIASFLGIAFVLILAGTGNWFQSEDSGNINCRTNCTDGSTKPPHDCHLDYYFFTLAGCEALGFVFFLIVSLVFLVDYDGHVHVRLKKSATRVSIQE